MSKEYKVTVRVSGDGKTKPNITTVGTTEPMTDVDIYYVGKALQEFGNTLSRHVSRLDESPGNDGQYITIIRKKIIAILHNRLLKYIEKNHIDIKESYLILYAQQKIIRLHFDDKYKKYFKGINKELSTIKLDNIIFDLLDIDITKKRSFIITGEYYYLDEMLSGDDLSFLDKYIEGVYHKLDSLDKLK